MSYLWNNLDDKHMFYGHKVYIYLQHMSMDIQKPNVESTPNPPTYMLASIFTSIFSFTLTFGGNSFTYLLTILTQYIRIAP